MQHLGSLTENFRFMVTEVTAQVEQTLRFLAEPSRTLVEKISSRDDYIDNLKSLIEDKTFILARTEMEKNRVNLLRSINTIAANLERIADFAVNIVRQVDYLTDPKFLLKYEYENLFEEVLKGLERILEALERRELGLAFKICQCEFNLDLFFEVRFKRVLTDLKAGGETGNLITTLFILRYLERMGDSLLNIGEAIIFALVGEKMKIHQYRALRDSLAASGLETPISAVEFESIWGTRSGCRIGTVQEKNQADPTRPVLFKQGNLKKLTKEKENIEKWDQLVPGLPPQVCGFLPDEDENGSILLEYLPGCTLQELLISGEEILMKDALFMVEDTLTYVWRATLNPTPVKISFIDQIRSRMEDVYRLHPGFQTPPARIGDLKVFSFGELLQTAERIERELSAPFSVLIHGDLNLNNIIYQSEGERIHFIDLHRSSQADYLQDVSVFMVSCFRLPIMEQAIRARLNYVILDFYDFAKKFSLEQNDGIFEARLALGLARSFSSSTRFEWNRKFAKKMHLRSVYLLEKLSGHRGQPWEAFKLPEEILVL